MHHYASHDLLWEPLCYVRWKGKQNVPNKKKWESSLEISSSTSSLGDSYDDGFRSCQTTVSSMSSASNVSSTASDGNSNFCDASTVVANNILDFARHVGVKKSKLSWKGKYLLAEIDRKRKKMTKKELSTFRWRLYYNGVPSRMGLRHFRSDGTYSSPYLGVCQWDLNERTCTLTFADTIVLYIRRNEDNWGWIIGKGTNTEYHSVEISGEM